MSNNNLYTKPYVKWLEEALQELVNLPVKGIYIHAVLDGGEVYTNPYNISMMDKLTIAGLVQQDAMLDSLVASGVIDYADEEEDEDGETEIS